VILSTSIYDFERGHKFPLAAGVLERSPRRLLVICEINVRTRVSLSLSLSLSLSFLGPVPCAFAESADCHARFRFDSI